VTPKPKPKPHRLKTGAEAKALTVGWWINKALWHLNWPEPQNPPPPRKK
jgi:hypothetical protein